MIKFSSVGEMIQFVLQPTFRLIFKPSLKLMCNIIKLFKGFFNEIMNIQTETQLDKLVTRFINFVNDIIANLLFTN